MGSITCSGCQRRCSGRSWRVGAGYSSLTDFFRVAAARAANSCAGDEKAGKEAKDAYNAGKDPGTFFQYICGLFNAHELVAETGDIASQATTFGVLNQNDKS